MATQSSGRRVPWERDLGIEFMQLTEQLVEDNDDVRLGFADIFVRLLLDWVRDRVKECF